jgi:hypothetical protein
VSIIKTCKYKEFRGSCPHSSDERETYHYPEPEELGPDDDSKELLPVGQNDHCMDVDRYLTLMTYRVNTKVGLRSMGDGKIEETHAQRIARLKRRPGSTQTENWS